MKTLWIEDEDALNVGRIIVTKTGTNDCVVCYSCDEIDDCKTRLNIIDILKELQLEIEEMSGLCTEIRGEEWSEVNVIHSQDVLNLIQEKINALKGDIE